MLRRWWRVVQDDDLWHTIAIGGLLVLVAYLRLVNLAWNPGWYPDEGSDLNIARHFAEGRVQYFALGGTPLVAARVPLFHFMLLVGFSVGGYDLLTARLVVAIANITTIVLLYWAARQILNRRVALLAAWLLTILPDALLYNRIAFAYNVQVFFYVLCWWSLWKFSTTRGVRWLVVAALAAGAAYMTALTGLALVLCVLLIVLWYAPRHSIWTLLVMLAPGAFYLGHLFLAAPEALFQDLNLVLSRTDSLDWVTSIFILVANYAFWLDWMAAIGIGITGLFLLEDRKVRVMSLVIVLMTMLNAMRMMPGDLSFHRYLALLPFIALGAANFILRAQRFLVTQLHCDLSELSSRVPYLFRWQLLPRMLVGIAAGGLLFAPLIWMGLWDVYFVSSREAPRATRLDAVLALKPSDAVVVTDYVNQQTQPDDVVLASPTIAWRLDARVADFEQMLAFDGKETENYGAHGMPRTRFVFAPTLENATFVIVDSLWRGWAVREMPDLREYLQKIQTWPRVMQRGNFEVYRNPVR